MKLIGSVVFLSAVALAHPSGLWWGTDFCYPSPENTDNHCSTAQESGFDWSELGNGDNWSYEGFSFDGFAPKDGCRASGGKCIEGVFSREDNWELQIDAEQAPFSVRKFHITTSRDADIIMTYLLADGSTCRQIASTSPMGSDVVNEQCGDAVSVKFQLSVLDQVGEVDLELHQMGFDCSSGPKPAGPLVAPPSPSTSAVFIPTAPVESHKPSTSVVKVSTSTHEPPVVTAPIIWTTRVVTVTRCPDSVTDCPDHATVTASTPWHTTVTEPVKQPPQTTVPLPCLNTWLSVPKCTSNSDAACFCPSSEFTDKFNSCVHAWSSSQQETDSALAYFAGICAPYVPKNPAIISIVPTTTPSSSVPAQHVTGAPSPTGHIVPMTSAPEPPCTTLSWSSHTVTVPQVGFSTHTDASTTVVSLVTGNPDTKSSTSPHGHTTCTSTFTKAKSTTVTTLPISPPKPTSTVVLSNVGSKAVSGSLWALGLAILVLPLQ
ncbi:uncharacterized protein N7484_005446 [Penicillium longicatenatum]|uniref:uncharacterized protein n=1 Tax=Penicillium longicatenatum TaxID=1561947 RepID=UPI0025475F73|nr:uncharacterized protein N7484_005446 [Penicillium longicatenatum]KAJ5642939.1 hypothetical protein N7484_005446 [Penicillium longicatenatum]